MLCQNCGKNEANVRYTQIINGVKKQMSLCDKCAKELGVEDINFNMPISFLNFLDDMFGTYQNEGFLGGLTNTKTLTCNKCGMLYDDFFNNGNFGCEECYDIFSDRIDPILKNIHGANRHVGRLGKATKNEDSKNKQDVENVQNNSGVKANTVNKETKTAKANNFNNSNSSNSSNENTHLEMLKERLKLEIKEERYEDAAKTRDEIKRIETK